MNKKFLLVAISALVLSGCTAAADKSAAQPTEVKVDKLDISITVPSSKWKTEVSNYGSEGDLAEVSNSDGSRTLEIKKDATKVDSLDMLVKAAESSGLALKDKETFANGFGATFTEKGKTKTTFIYDVQVGAAQYRCQNGAYYHEEDLAAAIAVCKSIK